MKYSGGMTITPRLVDDLTVEITADPAQPILPLLLSTLSVMPEGPPMAFPRTPAGTGP